MTHERFAAASPDASCLLVEGLLAEATVKPSCRNSPRRAFPAWPAWPAWLALAATLWPFSASGAPPARAARGPESPASKVAAAPTSRGTPSASASASPSRHAFELQLERHVLSNGLEVILHEDHRTPVVAVNLWYHVGSKDEALGKNGFAHLFEHMMFQGSRHVEEDTFFKYLEAAGVSERNGTTNADRTNYFETLPRNQLALALWLESDRMGFLLDHVDEKTFASQRDVVKNERRQNYENAPYGLVRQFIHEALYPDQHPYRRLTIGTPEDLDAATLADVRGFFSTYYVPNNATLVLAGDFDRGEALALVEKYFADLPRGAEPKAHRTPIPAPLASEKRLVVEADVELPRLTLSWPTPPAYGAGDAELDAAAALLTRGKSSRLYKRLVYDMQIAQDVSANQGSAYLGSTFDITVTLKAGQDPEKVLPLVDAELVALRQTPIDAKAMARAKASLLRDIIFSLESVTARADHINRYNQLAQDPSYLKKDIERYEAITDKGVQKAVAEYLPLDRRVVTLVHPTQGAPRAGRLVSGGKP